MFSRFVAVVGVVMLSMLGIPAQASSLEQVAVTTDSDTSGGTVDCFYQENRHLPECQKK